MRWSGPEHWACRVGPGNFALLIATQSTLPEHASFVTLELGNQGIRVISRISSRGVRKLKAHTGQCTAIDPAVAMLGFIGRSDAS